MALSAKEARLTDSPGVDGTVRMRRHHPAFRAFKMCLRRPPRRSKKFYPDQNREKYCPNDRYQALHWGLTMRLSDTRLRRRKTKLLYTNHRFPPWPNGDDTPRSLEPIVRSQALRHFKQRRRIAIHHNQQGSGCARRCATPLLPILQCTY